MTLVEPPGSRCSRQFVPTRPHDSINRPAKRAAASLAHASYYASVAATIRALADKDAASYIRLGDQEAGNLHDAIAWAYANGQPRLALEIVRDTWFWFASRRMHASAMCYLRTGFEQIDDDSPEVAEAAGLALIADRRPDDETSAFLDRAACSSSAPWTQSTIRHFAPTCCVASLATSALWTHDRLTLTWKQRHEWQGRRHSAGSSRSTTASATPGCSVRSTTRTKSFGRSTSSSPRFRPTRRRRRAFGQFFGRSQVDGTTSSTSPK